MPQLLCKSVILAEDGDGFRARVRDGRTEGSIIRDENGAVTGIRLHRTAMPEFGLEGWRKPSEYCILNEGATHPKVGRIDKKGSPGETRYRPLYPREIDAVLATVKAALDAGADYVVVDGEGRVIPVRD